MSLELFDTHVHLSAPDYDADREPLLVRAESAGVTRFLNIGAGYGVDSAKAAVTLSEKYSNIWASVGLHPHDAALEIDTEELSKLGQHPRVIAIGETGLDYFKELSPRKAQIDWYIWHIELAKNLNKPLIIHCREAGEDCIRLLIEHGASKVGGVFHCYAEDSEFAKRLAEINFLISLPGTLTFKKAEKVRLAARDIPLSQIMLETDGPFLAPEPYRGKRCESAFMLETAKMLASIKGLSLEEVAKTTTANALKLFHLGGDL